MPSINTDLARLVVGELPAMIIILVIEHIAIAKSFGKQFGYRIVPSQEIIAQGAANVLGPFVGGYVCTGSFGASAVLSKAGTRTPLGVFFSAIILIIVLYALTGLLFYIPMASLAALIIHATLNLISLPPTLFKYWRSSPLEFIIWVTGLAIAIFDSLEMSIYITIGLSMALLLIRMARGSGSFLGQARAQTVSSAPDSCRIPFIPVSDAKNVFLPLTNRHGFHPTTHIASPYPGVFVYRFRHPFNYLNQAQQIDQISEHILAHTTSAKEEGPDTKPSDRLWVDRGTAPVSEKRQLWGTGVEPGIEGSLASKPLLRSLVLDFSAVSSLDITSLQGLQDLRHVLDRHAGSHVVGWYFSNVQSRWTRRTLALAGFGFPSESEVNALKPVYAVARQAEVATGSAYAEEGLQQVQVEGQPLFDVTRPRFHADLETAVHMAVMDAKQKD